MKLFNSLTNQEPSAQVIPDNFWAHIGGKEHILQFYQKDSELIRTLANYVAKGFDKNESVVIICTQEHQQLLDQALGQNGYDLDKARTTDHFITLNAADVLAQFMVNDWPVKALFRNAIIPIIERAGSNGKTIRAFGEMVMLLWNRGLQAATIQLENLWNELATEYDFYLFCAYASSGFDDSQERQLHHICKSHSKIIRGTGVEGELYVRET